MTYLENDAIISDCGSYRYLLRRVWNHDLPRVLIIMLNPSTADASVDDPTIRSCVRLCKSHGHGSFEVVNLFAWRATDPRQIEAVPHPVGPENDAVIRAAVNRCDEIICAWGAFSRAEKRGREVLRMISRPAVFCWGQTKSGAPKHPLYIKTGTLLMAFRI